MSAESILPSPFMSPNSDLSFDPSETPLEKSGALISRFETSHDCAGSSGYTFLMPDGKKISVCTDLGVVTEGVRSAIKGSDAILIESNHDVEMLKNGRYSYPLKKRILSALGHLSNDNAAWAATQLAMWGTCKIVLGHLSSENNTPSLAYEAAHDMLCKNGAQIGGDVILKVAPRSGILEI